MAAAHLKAVHDDTQLPFRTLKAIAYVDAMEPSLRACVHDFGPAIVNACVANGVRQPSRIRHLVKEIWDGARQPWQGSSERKKGDGALATLDWLLIQRSSHISAKELVRVLHDHGWLLVPAEPSPQMIAASMATVSNFDVEVSSKLEKHRLRLRAAFLAARRHFWPHLSETRP